MAEASWPFYGVETNETQFSKWARTLVNSGISSGLAVVAGTGLQVLVAIGSAVVRGVYYENDAQRALAIGAAPAAGNTRLDAVVLRLDQTANTITVAVKAGTANNSGGALPALTQNETTWEMLIATVTVASGTATINNGMILEHRPSTGLRVLNYDSDARRPTPADPVALGLQTTAKRLDLWIGGAWVSLLDVANLTGILPPEKGGTGAASAKAGLRALGIYVQPTAPAHAVGRVWIPGTEPA